MKKILIEYNQETPVKSRFEYDLREYISSLQSAPSASSVEFSYGNLQCIEASNNKFLGATLSNSAPLNGIIAGEFSESLIPHIKNVKDVLSVWDDLQIYPATSFEASTAYQDNIPIGTSSDVIETLNCQDLWDKGRRGENTVIAVCDTGIDKSQFNVIDGWSPNGTSPWGSAGQGSYGFHGSMVAHAALLAAPKAEILDIGILKYRGSRGSWLSEALIGFNWLLNWCENNPSKRVIVNNSWSTYRRIKVDENINSYAQSPNHPFTKRCSYIASLGIPMIFAAGNCGCPKPDLRCGSDDVGDGKSIWGVNSLESVFTIGAVSLRGSRLPYSSTGPGFFFRKKPDVCSYSHFKGFLEVDPGTSTSAPVVAGMIALILSFNLNLSKDEVFDALRKTAKNNTDGWSPELGFGIANLKTAYEYLF
ncbi:S8 family serine peptidase [uncultured Pseudoalteromonas sp.]|uniref:S8 family peptidase n=1 Tax=uncultured Pseudoalteromonas sp. TaxID=114053 RepID=UPI0025D11915|nr:S8 family serine peptidase [uncultured Pseudoalteromonas sp.]|tara:strand:+ start:6551 stop:7810 length:1260 start_codon:yes stop_codon:yes gene_type:complete